MMRSVLKPGHRERRSGLAGLPVLAPISGKTGFGEVRRSLVRGISKRLFVAVLDRYAQ